MPGESHHFYALYTEFYEFLIWTALTQRINFLQYHTFLSSKYYSLFFSPKPVLPNALILRTLTQRLHKLSTNDSQIRECTPWNQAGKIHHHPTRQALSHAQSLNSGMIISNTGFMMQSELSGFQIRVNKTIFWSKVKIIHFR